MTTRKIILITGMCGSGKTTIASTLNSRFNVPLISMDHIKENLFEALGPVEKLPGADELEAASVKLFCSFVQLALYSSPTTTLVVEGVFDPKYWEAWFKTTNNRSRYKLLQIVCKADKKTCQERRNKRVESGERHKGHRDEVVSLEDTALLEKLYIGSDLPTVSSRPYLVVDTNGHVPNPSYEEIFGVVNEFLYQ